MIPDATILTGIAVVSAAISGLLTIWNFFQAPATKLSVDFANYKKDTNSALEAMKKETNTALEGMKKDTADKLDELDDRLVILEKGVGTIETTLKSMPTKDDLHKVEMRIEKMDGAVQVVSTTLDAVKETNDLMRDWLLNKGVQ